MIDCHFPNPLSLPARLLWLRCALPVKSEDRMSPKMGTRDPRHIEPQPWLGWQLRLRATSAGASPGLLDFGNI